VTRIAARTDHGYLHACSPHARDRVLVHGGTDALTGARRIDGIET
jgi:hypothetical protein